MDLLFFTAIGLSVAAVRPLALPLIKVADALPVSPTGVSRSGAETLVE